MLLIVLRFRWYWPNLNISLAQRLEERNRYVKKNIQLRGGAVENVAPPKGPLAVLSKLLELLINDLLKPVRRRRPGNEAIIDDQGWCRVEAEFLSLFNVFFELGLKFTRIKALAEGLHLQPQFLGQVGQAVRRELFLAAEEEVLVLPEFALFRGAAGSEGCTFGPFVAGHGKIFENPLDAVLVCLPEFPYDLVIPSAGGALVVGKLDNGERGILGAVNRVVLADADLYVG